MTRSARRPRRTRRAVVTAGAVCVTLLGLAGCSGDRLGAAAVVDGRTITTEALQSSTRAYLDVVPGADAGDTQLAILQQDIVSDVLDTVARNRGVRVSEGRIARERDDLLERVGGRRQLVLALAQAQQPSVLSPTDVDRWVRNRLLFNAIAADICSCDPDTADDAVAQQALNRANTELRDASASMDIEVSPRYGRWDPDAGIRPLVSGGLSRTVDELQDQGA